MIKNILVIRNDRFGEFLLNIPAMRALKERYPQARLNLAVDSAVCELASVVAGVDAVVVWDAVKRNLRKYKFDLCVVLNPTKEAHWAVFWSGIPVRVGYDRKWGILLTHKLKDTKHLGNRHEVDCNLELVGLLGAKTLDKTLKIKVVDSLFREFIGQRIVAIHPFTSDLVKQWPVERFVELAKKIMQENWGHTAENRGQSTAGTVPDSFACGGDSSRRGQSAAGTVLDSVKVVFVGRDEGWGHFSTKGTVHCGDSPLRQGQSTAGTVPGVMDLVNKTSLVELGALLKRCSLLVSGDSGPMHLAAAVGTPVVALFRNDLPGKTARRWGPRGEGHMVIEKDNLNDITVDEVFEKVKLALACRPLLTDSAQ